MSLAEWFLVQTTDMQRRQLSRSLVDACPGTWWARQFGRSALLPPPPTVDQTGELGVYPVMVHAAVLDAMLMLMHRPDRVEDAARAVPLALKPTTTLRQWRDALEEFGFQTGPRDVADEDDNVEPLAKRKRVHTPYDRRLLELGEAWGDYLLTHHPDAMKFVQGRCCLFTTAICYHRTDPALSFDIPRHAGNTSLFQVMNKEAAVAAYYTTCSAYDKNVIHDGILKKFPRGATVSSSCIIQFNSSTGQHLPGYRVEYWPLNGSMVHWRDASVWGMDISYPEDADE